MLAAVIIASTAGHVGVQLQVLLTAFASSAGCNWHNAPCQTSCFTGQRNLDIRNTPWSSGRR